MLNPLIDARAIHFASSIMVGGAAIFSAFVAPTLSEGDGAASAHAIAERQLGLFVLAALLFAVGSGALWLVILASNIGQSSMAHAITDGTAWSVFTETQFGRVWEFSSAPRGRACLYRAAEAGRSILKPASVIAGRSGACGSFRGDVGLVWTWRRRNRFGRYVASCGRRPSPHNGRRLGWRTNSAAYFYLAAACGLRTPPGHVFAFYDGSRHLRL